MTISRFIETVDADIAFIVDKTDFRLANSEGSRNRELFAFAQSGVYQTMGSDSVEAAILDLNGTNAVIAQATSVDGTITALRPVVDMNERTFRRFKAGYVIEYTPQTVTQQMKLLRTLAARDQAAAAQRLQNATLGDISYCVESIAIQELKMALEICATGKFEITQPIDPNYSVGSRTPDGATLTFTDIIPGLFADVSGTAPWSNVGTNGLEQLSDHWQLYTNTDESNLGQAGTDPWAVLLHMKDVEDLRKQTSTIAEAQTTGDLMVSDQDRQSIRSGFVSDDVLKALIRQRTRCQQVFFTNARYGQRDPNGGQNNNPPSQSAFDYHPKTYVSFIPFNGIQIARTPVPESGSVIGGMERFRGNDGSSGGFRFTPASSGIYTFADHVGPGHNWVEYLGALTCPLVKLMDGRQFSSLKVNV